MARQEPDQPKNKPSTEKSGPLPRYDDRPEARGARFDDRPEASGQESEETPKKGKGTTPKLAPGLPDYGDVEPGDPRHIDVEGI